MKKDQWQDCYCSFITSLLHFVHKKKKTDVNMMLNSGLALGKCFLYIPTHPGKGILRRVRVSLWRCGADRAGGWRARSRRRGVSGASSLRLTNGFKRDGHTSVVTFRNTELLILCCRRPLQDVIKMVWKLLEETAKSRMGRGGFIF